MSLDARMAAQVVANSRYTHRPKLHRNRSRLALPSSAKPRHVQIRDPLELQTLLRRPRSVHVPDQTCGIPDDGDPGPSPESSSSLSSPADVLRLMDSLRVPVEADVYATLLQECAASADVEQGAAVHAHLRRGGGRCLNGRDAALVANRLLLMYCACGQSNNALQLFDRLPDNAKCPATWAVMIVGLSENGDPTGAMRLFVEMLERGFEEIWLHPAGCIAMAAVVRSCTETGKFRFGQCLHGLVRKVIQNSRPGGDHRWRRVGCSLTQFYGRLGHLDRANRVFSEMGCGSSCPTCIKTMIKAYCRVSMFHEALGIFKAARMKAVRKNSYVVFLVLRACGNLEADEGFWHGLQVHAAVIKTGMETDWWVQQGLVAMYGKLGHPVEARKAFDLVGGRKDDEACWSEMLRAYVRDGRGMDALRLLYEMKAAGLKPRESMVADAQMTCGLY